MGGLSGFKYREIVTLLKSSVLNFTGKQQVVMVRQIKYNNFILNIKQFICAMRGASGRIQRGQRQWGVESMWCNNILLLLFFILIDFCGGCF